jgi:glutamate-ammonia-ligase adenylyltransferase
VLDLLFAFDQDGQTQRAHSRGDRTSNHHFFSQLAQRVVQALGEHGPLGSLFEVHVFQQLTGFGGVAAVLQEQLQRHLQQRLTLAQWVALAKARVIYGQGPAARDLTATIAEGLLAMPWQPHLATELRKQRMRLEATASAANLKRGVGGTIDVEYITQLIQLRDGRSHPEILCARTIDSLDAIRSASLLSSADHATLRDGYLFLRRVESGLRLMNRAARHDLPTDPAEADKLAYLLQDSEPASLASRCEAYRAEHRRLFESIFDEAETTLSSTSY